MDTNRTNTDRTNGFPANDDADWAALRYVLGEMSPEEADRYEQLLATDPHACEQVVASARLTTDLYAALHLEVERELSAEAARCAGSRVRVQSVAKAAPDRPTRAALWAVVGLVAAVCLLAAGGLSLAPFLGNQHEVASDNSDTGAGSLVAIWTERSAESAPETAAEFGNVDGVTADDSLSLTEADDAVAELAAESVLIADDEDSVPGWLIVAVGGDWKHDEIREN